MVRLARECVKVIMASSSFKNIGNINANNSNFNLTFLSFNCNGQANQDKRRKQYIFLRESKADIILLQETHYVEKKEIIYQNEWGGHCFF